MATQQNKKLSLGILLTFIICIGSAILATYSTGPYGNYPNPGVHPGMIGPGTFNDSGVANPQWKIPGGLIIGNPAGGNMGTGTINAEGFYKNGVLFNGSGGGIGGLECTVRLKSTRYGASCLPGETCTGGGCSCPGVGEWMGSSTPSGNGWSCSCPGAPGSLPTGVYAVCCNITGGGTSTEEKYCKRTSATYNGNLGGTAGADAKCVAEFGAGWSFADTAEEYRQITRVDAEFYNRYSPDGLSSYSPAWIELPGYKFNCDNWTDGVSFYKYGGVLSPRRVLSLNSPHTVAWSVGSLRNPRGSTCVGGAHIWCCPP